MEVLKTHNIECPLWYMIKLFAKHVAGKNPPLDYKTYSMDLNLTHNFRKAGIKLGLDIRPYLVDNKSYGNGSVWNNTTGVQQLSPLG